MESRRGSGGPVVSLDGLRCHHGDDTGGHELGPSCPLQVKAGRYDRPSAPSAPVTARGTCPGCGREGVKVEAVVVRAIGPADRISHAIGKGIPLGRRPQLVAHKRPGRGAGPCPAVAATPVELTYRPSADLAGWIRDYGTEHVA